MHNVCHIHGQYAVKQSVLAVKQFLLHYRYLNARKRLRIGNNTLNK
jgi:hypothetical protein